VKTGTPEVQNAKLTFTEKYLKGTGSATFVHFFFST
jgi:hypothetical protein